MTDDDIAARVRRTVRELAVGWWLFALAVGALVAFVLWVYTPWVVFGLFVYYVARPIAARMERRVGPNLAAAVTLTLIVVPIVALLVVATLVAIGQLATVLTADAIADLLERLGLAAVDLPTDPAEVVRAVLAALREGAVQAIIGSVSRTVGSVAATLYNLFLALLFSFFLLREDGRLAAWFRAEVAGEETDTYRYLAAVDRGLRSVYFGYTLTIFVIIVLTAVIYSVFNLFAPPGLAIPSTILLAVLTGAFTIIPLVGRTIVYLAVVAYMVARALPENPAALWFPAVFFLVMEIPFDNLVRSYIRPVLSGGLFQMSLVMFAYLLGPPLFGWYGIFLGPLLMVVSAVFIRWKLPRLLHPDREEPEIAAVPGGQPPGTGRGDEGEPGTERAEDSDRPSPEDDAGDATNR